MKFGEGLARLDSAGVRSFICHGNHDPLDGWEARLDLPPGCVRFGPDVTAAPVFPDEPERATVYGISYPRREVRENLSPLFRLAVQRQPVHSGPRPGRTTGDLFRRLRPADHHRCPGPGHRTNDLAGLDAHRGHTGAFFPPCWCWGGAPEPRKQRQRRLLTEDTDRIQMARGGDLAERRYCQGQRNRPSGLALAQRAESLEAGVSPAVVPPLAAGLGALVGQGAAHRRRFHRRPGGAPLPLRLFVESVLAVSQQDRRSGKPTDLNISLRELLSRLYPGQRTPRPTEYWPRIMQAVHALDSDEARIPARTW